MATLSLEHTEIHFLGIKLDEKTPRITVSSKQRCEMLYERI